MQRPTFRIAATSMIAFWLAATPLLAQQNQRGTFVRAQMLDETNQNLGEAIDLYSQVVAAAKNNRALAATALLRVGRLYLRTGRTNDAMRTFRVLVAQYPDQSQPVSRAKTKLALLAARIKPAKVFELTREGPSGEGGTLASFTAPEIGRAHV